MAQLNTRRWLKKHKEESTETSSSVTRRQNEETHKETLKRR